jgi:hypothetical protein
MALFACATATGHAKALPIDFSSQAGLEATCPRLRDARPADMVRNEERAAYAICAGISIATDAMTWWREAQGTLDLQKKGGRDLARARLESYLSRIAAIRGALEGIKAGKPLFAIEPGTWAVDFDGDGAISLQERYFFWTPKRGLDMSPLERSDSEERYREAYMAPIINVDQSDVYWALAYCNFAEAALNLVLSYDLSGGDHGQIVLADPERVRSAAYHRLLEGIRDSVKLRASLLAETHDDREWIPNPRQTHTSFPLPMDKQTFATWGELLGHLQSLLDGKSLLAGRTEAGLPPLDLTFGICPAGTGIDVRELFMNPLRHVMDPSELTSRCVAPTTARPMTGLGPLISASLRRNAAAAPHSGSGEWVLLRHLYWVN